MKKKSLFLLIAITLSTSAFAEDHWIKLSDDQESVKALDLNSIQIIPDPELPELKSVRYRTVIKLHDKPDHLPDGREFYAQASYWITRCGNYNYTVEKEDVFDKRGKLLKTLFPETSVHHLWHQWKNHGDLDLGNPLSIASGIACMNPPAEKYIQKYFNIDTHPISLNLDLQEIKPAKPAHWVKIRNNGFVASMDTNNINQFSDPDHPGAKIMEYFIRMHKKQTDTKRQIVLKSRFQARCYDNDMMLIETSIMSSNMRKIFNTLQGDKHWHPWKTVDKQSYPYLAANEAACSSNPGLVLKNMLGDK